MPTIGEICQRVGRINAMREGLRDIASSLILPDYAQIKTPIGVEFEYENVRWSDDGVTAPLAERYFDFHTDNSLRNHGQEFVSKVGYTGEDVLKLTDVLTRQILPKLHRQVECSKRTSFHVHWSIDHLTEEQIKQIVLAYLVTEKIFFKLSGDRADNIFCVPLINAPTNWQKWFTTSSPFITATIRGVYVSLDWAKYAALNLLPIYKLGTIEFRHHEGTANGRAMYDWILTINNLINWALSFKSYNELLKTLREMHTTEHYFSFDSIFRHHYLYTPDMLQLLLPENFNKVLMLIDLPVADETEFIPEYVNKTKKKQNPDRGITGTILHPDRDFRRLEQVFVDNEPRFVLREPALPVPGQPREQRVVMVDRNEVTFDITPVLDNNF
jgi:hypothetical protein